MNNREKEIISNTVDILKKHLNPAKIILFGSRVKGLNTEQADFDFAVDSPRPEISIQRRIIDEIEKKSGLYKVDIVYLPSIDKKFKEIILNTGRVIYEK